MVSWRLAYIVTGLHSCGPFPAAKWRGLSEDRNRGIPRGGEARGGSHEESKAHQLPCRGEVTLGPEPVSLAGVWSRGAIAVSPCMGQGVRVTLPEPGNPLREKPSLAQPAGMPLGLSGAMMLTAGFTSGSHGQCRCRCTASRCPFGVTLPEPGNTLLKKSSQAPPAGTRLGLSGALRPTAASAPGCDAPLPRWRQKCVLGRGDEKHLNPQVLGLPGLRPVTTSAHASRHQQQPLWVSVYR